MLPVQVLDRQAAGEETLYDQPRQRGFARTGYSVNQRVKLISNAHADEG